MKHTAQAHNGNTWPFDTGHGHTRDAAMAMLIACLDPFQGSDPFVCEACECYRPEQYGCADDYPEYCDGCCPNA